MPTTSGAGNGPFGFGWSLSLPSITRKTDKGLPQYFDAVDSDVFILSGAEDLVPVYRQDPDGTWIAGRPGFQRVSRYAPARRCERVLMLHHIPDLPAAPGWAAQPGYRGVVRSIEFTYDDELDPTFKLYIERWPVWGLCW